MGRREKTIFTNINAAVTDIIQVKVSVPLESVDLVLNLVNDYNNYLDIPYYNLQTEIKRRKPSIISILRNQISIFNMDKAISVLPINKKEKESSLLENDYRDEEYDNEEIENNDIITFRLDIHIKEFINSILSYESITEEDIWMGNNINININSCKSIFSLFYNIMKDLDPTNTVFSYIYRLIVSNKFHFNVFKHHSLERLKRISSLEELSLDTLYEMIIYHISILFGNTMLKIIHITPTEIFISTRINASTIDTMRTIHSVLDYSQTSMDIISGILEYGKNDYTKTALKNAVTNFHNNIIPVGYSIQNNFNTSFYKNSIFIDYRGLNKPHGEGYLDAGYSFFRVSGNIKSYIDNNDMKKEKRIPLGNYLNPNKYISYFTDKLNEKNESIIFAFTLKFYSLREKMFNPINKGLVSFLSQNTENNLTMYKVLDKYIIYKKDIESICVQIGNPIDKSKLYNAKIKSNKFSFYSVEDMVSYGIQRLLIDPIKVIIRSNKIKNTLIEFNIRKSVEYFMSTLIEDSSFINLIKCIEDLNELLKKYSRKELTIIDRIDDLNMNENYTIKDLINSLADDTKTSFKDKEIHKEFIDEMMIIICSYIPISTVFIDGDREGKSVEFLIRLVYSYMNSKDYSLSDRKSEYRFNKICKFIRKLLYIELLNKNYIDKIEYNYMTESRDTSFVSKYKDKKQTSAFDYQNIKENTLKLCLLLEEELKCKS